MAEERELIDKVHRLEWELEAAWKTIDDLKTTVKEHHNEDDTRFSLHDAKFEEQAKRAIALITSICVACVVLLVNAAVFWAKAGH